MTQRKYAQFRARQRAQFAWVQGLKLRHGERYEIRVITPSGRSGVIGSFVADRKNHNPLVDLV
jgi:hypothetical protein